jgi:hypothetical protein
MWGVGVISFFFFICLVQGHSDEFGRNPQHEFGSAIGRSTNPVLPFWTMLGDAFANEDYVRLTLTDKVRRVLFGTLRNLLGITGKC